MFESMLLESGKVFRGRRISGIGAEVIDDTEDFTIPVSIPPPPEGFAVITNIDVPTSFISGDWVVFKITVQNTAEPDYIFCRIVNKDTGQTIVSTNRHLNAGEVWTFTNLSNYITQTTDFHGRVEAGHLD